MDMRVRFSELLDSRGWTPYRLAKESGGAISMSQAYRLHRSGGKADYFEAKALRVICDLLGVTDFNELFSRDDEAPPKPPARAKRVRAT